MEIGNISLQYKVLLGYMILVVAVCGMVSILLYERDRMRTIRSETAEIRRIWHDISTAHRHITELATDGESVIVWEDADFRDYHGKRLHTDSLLQTLKSSCGMFVLPGQIDSLCHLLEAKEEHLSHIMKAIAQLEEADSLLATVCQSLPGKRSASGRSPGGRQVSPAGSGGKECTGPRTVGRATGIE